jgi:hypothetical protein
MEADCQDCQTCAFDSLCMTQYADCQAEPQCIALDECVSACREGDDACVQACVDANPNGADPLLALLECIFCDACYVTCDGASNC